MIWIAISVVMTLSTIAALGGYLSLKKAQTPISEEKPKNLVFETLWLLLDNSTDWDCDKSAHCIVHKSGLQLWIANRPYGDMAIWNLNGNAEKFKFSDDLRDKLRPKVDKIVLDYKIRTNTPLTDEEAFFATIKKWEPEDPHMKELLSVL